MEKKTLITLLSIVARAQLRDSSMRVMLYLLTLPGNCIDWTKFSQREVSKELGIKLTAMCHGVKELCELGFVEKKGKSKATEYRIVLGVIKNGLAA